jgi:pimeloyl-ACP methyl ester carboxylesterase
MLTASAPTLIVDGDRDVFFPVDIAVQMYTSISKSYLWIVPNGGHVPIGAHVAEFVNQVSSFLSGNWDNANAP